MSETDQLRENLVAALNLELLRFQDALREQNERIDADMADLAVRIEQMITDQATVVERLAQLDATVTDRIALNEVTVTERVALIEATVTERVALIEATASQPHVDELRELRDKVSSAIGEAMLVRIEMERLDRVATERSDRVAVRLTEVETRLDDAQLDVSTAIQLERLDEVERAVGELRPPPPRPADEAARPSDARPTDEAVRFPPPAPCGDPSAEPSQSQATMLPPPNGTV